MDKQKVNVNNMSKEEKLNALRNIAWELAKFPPQELKKQGINPLNLIGVNFSAKEMLDEMGIDIESEADRVRIH